MSEKKKDKSKEEAILAAAKQEFVEKGFVAAKTTKIAAMAGVTHAMLHYYFRTKENLFDTIFDKEMKLLKDAMFASFDNPDMTFLEKVQKSIEDHFDFVKAYPRMPRFVMNELIVHPERLKHFQRKINSLASSVLKRMGEEIDREVAKGTINPIHPVTLLVDISSLNLFVFTMLPLIKNFAVKPYGSEEAFLEARKKENVEIILRRLTK
ncbi:MAG: TetR/AcrR family transcriptional regulator [Tannerella sp.]|jgi:AcrR family transcriptional regulator|nr:TetR/AcrR family transcriptional regulator [Tannerella sp.]